jgi:hypothetical protein
MPVGGLLNQTSTASSVEANLDIQYTAGLLPPSISTTYYSTPGRGPLVPDLDQPDPENSSNEPYLDYFTYLVGLEDKELPQVLTTSYGEDEQSVPPEYAKKVCDMIGQLGTRGVSVLFCKLLSADSVAWMASRGVLMLHPSQPPHTYTNIVQPAGIPVLAVPARRMMARTQLAFCLFSRHHAHMSRQ